MDKVSVPKEVANAIEALRANHKSTYVIICMVHEKRDVEGISILRNYAILESENLLKALVNGYEVEQTPKEIIEQVLLNADFLEDLSKDELEDLMLQIDMSLNHFNKIKRDVLKNISFRPSREKV